MRSMCPVREADTSESLEVVDPTVGCTERYVNLCFLRATKTPDDELHDEHAHFDLRSRRKANRRMGES